MHQLLVFTLLLFLAACSSTPAKHPPTRPAVTTPTVSGEPPIKLGPPLPVKGDSSVLIYPAEFNDLPGWRQNDHAAAFDAFRRSCDSWRKQPDDRMLSGVFELGRIGDWKKLCTVSVKNGQEQQFFEQWFKPYAVANNGSFDGLFTGYYVPELHGSTRPSVRYHVPIYRMPKDLVKQGGQSGRLVKGLLKPYYERSEIVAGALAGKGLELLWVDSEVDAFFMEVQGSGRVVMEDGRLVTLNYDGKNGRGYYAIGKTLVDNGEIPREAISMQSIRAWIAAHPQQGHDLMMQNQSYVFFRFGDSNPQQGPVGSMSVPLTAGHSLAVDRSYLPMGVPLWLDAEHPAGNQRLRRLVMAQDTGGAIKGLLRGDVFWGQGQQAAEFAGVMKSRGRYFLLIPRHIRVG
jgi:membrane-bound lytic murein transglycosylase A